MATTDQTRVRRVVGNSPKSLEEISRHAGLDLRRTRVAVEKLIARDRLHWRGEGLVKTHRTSKKRKTDALDHRVAGSFESGKRR